MHLNRLSQAIRVCLLFISCSSAGNGELGSKNFFLEAAEEPRLVRFESNGLVSYRGEGGLVTSMASFEGDEILLHSFVGEGVVAVDVYESEAAEYKYSFGLPNYIPAYIMNDRMYQVTDTTVVVFSIERKGNNFTEKNSCSVCIEKILPAWWDLICPPGRIRFVDLVNRADTTPG